MDTKPRSTFNISSVDVQVVLDTNGYVYSAKPMKPVKGIRFEIRLNKGTAILNAYDTPKHPRVAVQGVHSPNLIKLLKEAENKRLTGRKSGLFA